MMGTTRRGIILLLSMVMLAVFALSSSARTPPQNGATNSQATSQTQPASQNGQQSGVAPIDWWARISNSLTALGTIALAVIGAIAACIALSTLRTIARQTVHAKVAAEAARDSAGAALLNAQAVIDAERPWLVLTVEKNELMGTPGYFFFRVTNKGRTPAQVISGGFNIAFALTTEELPIPPNYEPFYAPNNVFLPPGDHFDIKRTEAEANTGVKPEQIIDAHFRNAEGTNKFDILFFYGNLVYSDVLGKERPGQSGHETRWCFAFFKDGKRFVRTGPSGTDEYNRYM